MTCPSSATTMASSSRTDQQARFSIVKAGARCSSCRPSACSMQRCSSCFVCQMCVQPRLQHDPAVQSATFVENLNARRIQRLGAVEDEIFVLLEKGEIAATVHATLRLVFRALIEAAQATDVLVSRVEQEHVDLMVSDAHLLLVPESV